MKILHLKRVLGTVRRRGLPFLLIGGFVWSMTGEAQAVSSWNPTLLVNTESFQVIDDGDGTTNIELRFGTTVDERLRWMINENRFEFSRDLRVAGTITATGSIAASGSLAADANLTINADSGAADAVITFGNDSGDETITFSDTTNDFQISDDVRATGNLAASGTLSIEGASSLQGAITAGSTIDAVGNITTDGNLTINENNSDADAVLTFGNDAGAKALTYSNANTRFEFADDVYVTGTLETTSNVTVGGTITLNGVTYTFPVADGTDNFSLTTDGAGTLTWENPVISQQGALDDRYVNVSGDTMTGNLIIGNGKTLSVSGTIITETNLTINQDNGAADAVLTFGNDAGAETITFSDSTNQFEMTDDLNITGNFDSDGNGVFAGTLEINDDNSGNATLTFGNDAGDETIIFNDSTNEFDISDDVNVTGTMDVSSNLTASGTLSVGGTTSLQDNTTVTGTLDTTGNITTDADLTINEDNGGANAVLTFGNDAGAENITFSDSTNQFEMSDDLQVGGNLDVNGNEVVSGSLEINDDNTGNATLTFGNDAGDETIIFNDSTNEFDVSDDVNVTGTMDVSSNLSASGVISAEGDISTDGNLSGSTLTVDGNVTLHGVTYGFPTNNGNDGQTLTTDGDGNLTWNNTSVGIGSGGVLFLSPEYPHAVYFNSGSVTNYIGQMSYDYDETNKENYYRWDTTKSTLQEYWISARVRVPDNFSVWDANEPIELRYRTGSGVTTLNYISMRLYDTAGSQVALTGGNQLANISWTTATITGPQAAGTYTKGSYITIALKLVASNPADTNDDGWVDAGYINLNWETTAP